MVARVADVLRRGEGLQEWCTLGGTAAFALDNARIEGRGQQGGWGREGGREDAPLHNSSRRHPLRPLLADIIFIPIRLVDNLLRDDLLDDICKAASAYHPDKMKRDMHLQG